MRVAFEERRGGLGHRECQEDMGQEESKLDKSGGGGIQSRLGVSSCLVV